MYSTEDKTSLHNVWAPLKQADGAESEAFERPIVTDDALRSFTYLMLDLLYFAILNHELYEECVELDERAKYVRQT